MKLVSPSSFLLRPLPSNYRGFGGTSMAFDFHTAPDRQGTGALKWERYSGRDIIPLWVADMDFKTAPVIQTAIMQRVQHGVFGYTLPPTSLNEAVQAYYEDRHQYVIEDKYWIFYSPGVVQSLNLVCRLVPKESAVMVLTPIYQPFLSAPVNTDRKLVTVPLVKRDGMEGSRAWTFDWDAMEEAAPGVRLLMLCNPQNPTGRVFSREELSQLGRFCEKHNMLICSDEIHCDLILDQEAKHLPMATIEGGRYADRTITLNAPSKTYNIPGMGCSYVVISNKDLRRQLLMEARGIVTQNPTLGYTACEAAYRYGEPWRLELLDYLRANRDLVHAFLKDEVPEVQAELPEATYMTWIDVRGMGWRDPIVHFEKAGVGLTDGRFFEGVGHVRLNFACPTPLLEEGLERFKRAVKGT
ncbi:unnamed protein product [Chrysoparadoxa australica]